jgi:hypothetical protein
MNRVPDKAVAAVRTIGSRGPIRKDEKPMVALWIADETGDFPMVWRWARQEQRPILNGA